MREIRILKAKEQRKTLRMKQHEEEEENEYVTLKKDTIILMVNAFGCTICVTMYCLYYAVFGIFPSRLNVAVTQTFCKYIGWVAVSWQFSRYFFYNFMLWRIQASFREPMSLTLSKYTLFIFFILIHLWILCALLTDIFFMEANMSPTGLCQVLLVNSSSIRITFCILLSLDTILTVGLLILFTRRLFQLTTQNERVNKYKKKTIILGMIATLTSILLVVANMLIVHVNEWKYLVPMDSIINLLCVVFTYKLSFININININTCCKKKKHQNVEYNETAKHESTISKQPNDSIVWDMLTDKNNNNENMIEMERTITNTTNE